MSEGTLVPRTAISPARRWPPALEGVRALFESEGLVIVVVALWVAVLAAVMPFLLVQDSWLSFVDGRLIARHWLPRVDTLTQWTLGRAWIDQQWGAHLALYELAENGGLRAALGLGVGCVAATVILTAVVARRLGASPRSVALGLLVPLFATPWLMQLRAQSLALLPFVVVYALLALDARQPGRRVLWVLALFVLWANLHGSVALGAGLAVVYGLWLARHRVDRACGLLLVVGSPLCLLVSPYGFRLVAYYRLMLLHPPLASFVNEWKPPAVTAATAIFFASALATTALWGAHRRVLTTFERWALPVLLVLALSAARNTVWFELAAAVALPRLLDAAWPDHAKPTPAIRRINLLIGSVAVATALLTCALAFTRAPAWFDRGVSPEAAAAVARAAGESGTVLADDAHADWLLWFQPSLAGRVDYDVRFELFNAHELRQIKLLQEASHPVWRRCGSRASVVTFAGPSAEQAALREQVLAPGSRTIVRPPSFIAVAQPALPRSGRCVL